MAKAKVTSSGNELLIKNGFVYDPANGIDGDIKDIAVQNGRIVEASKLTTGARVIDAKGKTVMAGGIDPHTHVAGPKVNVGRMFRPEDKLHDHNIVHTSKLLRAGGGFSVPIHVRYRIQVCEARLHNGQRGGNAATAGEAYARRDPGYAHPRPERVHAARQQLACDGVHQERRDGEARCLRRLDAQGYKGLCHQASQPRWH